MAGGDPCPSVLAPKAGQQLSWELSIEGHYLYLSTRGGAEEVGSHESRVSSHHKEIDEKPTHG